MSYHYLEPNIQVKLITLSSQSAFLLCFISWYCSISDPYIASFNKWYLVLQLDFFSTLDTSEQSFYQNHSSLGFCDGTLWFSCSDYSTIPSKTAGWNPHLSSPVMLVFLRSLAFIHHTSLFAHLYLIIISIILMALTVDLEGYTNLYLYPWSCPGVSESYLYPAIAWQLFGCSRSPQTLCIQMAKTPIVSPPRPDSPVLCASANGTIILHHSKQKALELSLMPTFCLILHIWL